MIARKKKISQNYFSKVDGDFVNIVSRQQKKPGVAGRAGRGLRGSVGSTSEQKETTVIMDFEIYINLYEALARGLDEVELVVTERDKFTLDYFSDKTPSGTANDINAFFTKAKKSLKEEADKQEIYSETFGLADFLPDRVVSRIGSGKINIKNYTKFLPKKDVISVENYKTAKASLENPINVITTDKVHTGSLNDDRDARDLAYDAFDTEGYDPAMISQVAFPSDSKLARSNGVKNNRLNPANYVIPQWDEENPKAPATFYQLHKSFFKSTASEITRYSLVETPKKIKFQPVKFRLRFNAEEENFLKIKYKTKLFLLLKFKKNGVPFTTDSFVFNSRKEIEKEKAKYKNLDLSVKAGDPSLAESDTIIIRNPNKFPLLYRLFEVRIIKGKISNEEISQGNIRAKSIITLDRASTIFGDPSESRSYRVISHRKGGIKLCNINEVITPSSVRKSTYDSNLPVIYATPSAGGTALVTVKNIPKKVDLVKIYRKDLGCSRQTSARYAPLGTGRSNPGRSLSEGASREYLVRVIDQDTTIKDSRGSLFHNSLYEYRAEFISNGSKIPMQISTVVHYMNQSSIARSVNFSIAKKSLSLTESSVSHTFMIEESLSQNAADKLLAEVNQIGQQNSYQEQLNEIKAETGTITSYTIERRNNNTGESEILDDSASPGALQTFTIEENINDQYTYIVKMNAVAAVAANFSNKVAGMDVSSGQKYFYSYRKFKGQEVIDNEALPSTETVVKNKVQDALRKGKSGRVAKTTFQPSGIRPKITNFSVDRDPFNNCNWLTWSISGSNTQIDHFLILAFYDGIQAPIGAACVPDKKNNRFFYRDTRMFNLLGEVIYQVVIVSKDFTYFTETPERSVRYLSTVPKFSTLGNK